MTTVIDNLFTNVQIPSGDLTSSSWNRFVYRVYEGSSITETTCTAMCAFDHDNIDGTYDYGCHSGSYDYYRDALEYSNKSIVYAVIFE